jgi:hypothetical protein
MTADLPERDAWPFLTPLPTCWSRQTSSAASCYY